MVIVPNARRPSATVRADTLGHGSWDEWLMSGGSVLLFDAQ